MALKNGQNDLEKKKRSRGNNINLDYANSIEKLEERQTCRHLGIYKIDAIQSTHKLNRSIIL